MAIIHQTNLHISIKMTLDAEKTPQFGAGPENNNLLLHSTMQPGVAVNEEPRVPHSPKEARSIHGIKVFLYPPFK